MADREVLLFRHMGHRLCIVGSGIMGLAHAVIATESGWDVTVLERSSRPQGASVRNFGAYWILGQRDWNIRNRCLRSRSYWKQLSAQADFPLAECGSLTLATLESGREVLREYIDIAADPEGLELLEPAQIARRFPAVRTEQICMGLLSRLEMVINPNEALGQIINWLRTTRNVSFVFDTKISKVQEGHLVSESGQCHEFDKAILCTGDDFVSVFPECLSDPGLQRCRLQMMKTGIQPDRWKLGPVHAMDLSLQHYPGFSACRSMSGLREEISCHYPDCSEFGIHVLVAQHHDGSLVVGDSHEYGLEFDETRHEHVDSIILDIARKLVDFPESHIENRWFGTYAKSRTGESVFRACPLPNIEIVLDIAGLGMTQSFGIAEQTFNGPGQKHE